MSNTRNITVGNGLTTLLESPAPPNHPAGQLADPPTQTSNPIQNPLPYQSAPQSQELASTSNTSPRAESPNTTAQPHPHSPHPPMAPAQPPQIVHSLHSPQMTTRSQHGIVKPRKLFNLHTSAETSISPLPTNPLNALHDHNWKMAMKDEYDALIENKMWGLGTLDLGLHLYPSSDHTLTSYIDADWGGCPDTRRSTSVEHHSNIYKDALYNESEFQQQALMIPYKIFLPKCCRQQAVNNSPEVTE
ncbi:hypothetical protein SADUNF_Sadunf16G0210600 [Salix dunnii]|uniref:Uncharacterized protein n=1 Tax=Salix dunnii TaxID=1413687 RepID=A0A835J9N6_9ROSI|nr:hypothetical protein SADUNF_Sadunf16G0210600 [Salix dunnii]